MDEEKNSAKQKLKEGLKPTKNMAYIALVIVLIVILLISSLYNIFKKDYEDMAENSATYSGNAMISATDGIVSYVKDEDGNFVTDENGNYIPLMPGDILEEINNISRYLKDDSESTKEEKLEYLLNAGLVTKFPYIERLAEDKVNGIVKFYRYSEESQAHLLTFIDEEEFNNKLDAGDPDIFNFFTMDENQQLVIACKSETIKTITTNDPEITEDVINEEASDTYTSNGNRIYTAGDSTITKQAKDYQSIIEQYTMPFNLLAAFLVQTGDYDFVKELADMAYESEINIGIYENVSITTKTDDYTYKKRIEYSPSTKLDFSSVNSVPEITADRYPKLEIECIANIQEDEETSEIRVDHKFKRLDGIEGTKGAADELETAYIKAMSNGIITELTEQASDAKMFETKYYSETESRTSVTLGTILADTWIARWEARYVVEPNDPIPQEPSTGTEPNSARTIIKCNASSDLFAGSAITKVDDLLKQHSKELKEKAIQYILDNTDSSDFAVSARSMTANDIRTHAESCTTCEQVLNTMFRNTWKENNDILTDSDLVRRVNTEEVLAEVKTHVQNKLNREAQNDRNQAKEEFKIQLNDIKCPQYSIVAKSNVDINFTTTNTRNSTTYKQDTTDRTKDGEKFKKLFNLSKYHEARQAILERIQWFWEYIRENDDTARLESVLRYLLNIATNSNRFGTFTEEDIENLFKAFEPKELQFTSVAGNVSPFGCNMEREEFINAALAYSKNEEYQRNLAAIAGEFYDICTSAEYNVNPGLAFAWALQETGGKDKNIPYNNLFGMGVYNGQNSGTRYSSRADSIRGFCQWVVNNVDSGGTLARAQEFATVNSKLQGTAENNIYVLFCQYFYLGDIHYVDEPDFNNPAGEEYYLKNGSTWGQGGRVYIYHMYELGGIYEGEYAERCGHPNSSDPTTLEEQADYVIYQVNKRLKIARDVFGNGIFGGGAYEEASDQDIRGIYTSSSGRTYIEWIQSPGTTTWGEDTIKFNRSWGKMKNKGCPIYAAAILVSSVISTSSEEEYVTPGIINENYYDGRESTTIQKILDDYNVNKTAKMVYNSSDYISKLQEGYGFATYVNSNSGFANSKHWIVVADIRTSELGSSYGYDVYILSSTTRGVEQTRWHPIEKVIDNLVKDFGCYISD